MNRSQSCVAKYRFTVAIITGIGCGVGIGLFLKNYTLQPWTEREIMYLQFPGELFLNIINCLILPLVVASIVNASSNLSKSGIIGIKALYYYTVTTIMGIILSVVLVQTIQPGVLHRKENVTIQESTKHFVTTDMLLDLLRNLFTDNLAKACLSKYQTVLEEPRNASVVPIYEWPISYQYTQGTNVLGIVFFGLILGLALGTMDVNGKPVLDFFHTFSEIIMILMEGIIRLTPISVLFLIPGKILEIEDFGAIVTQLGVYILTVFIGLLFHGFITLPLIYFICTRQSPYKIIFNIGPALVTACGTSSSTATVPMTIKCLDKLKINPKVTRFIAPIGATINMDGIALYETIGAMFIIQLRGLQFSLTRIIAISITCTISCIGAAGLPNGGYVMLVMVLNSVGIPSEDVVLIIAIDSLVDRFRTMVNIIADALGAGIIGHLIENDLTNIELDETVLPLRSEDGKAEKEIESS